MVDALPFVEVNDPVVENLELVAQMERHDAQLKMLDARIKILETGQVADGLNFIKVVDRIDKQVAHCRKAILILEFIFVSTGLVTRVTVSWPHN